MNKANPSVNRLHLLKSANDHGIYPVYKTIDEYTDAVVLRPMEGHAQHRKSQVKCSHFRCGSLKQPRSSLLSEYHIKLQLAIYPQPN